jgi:hypothetical protein
MSTSMVWDRAKLERFRKARQRAQDEGSEVFTFEGADFLVTYAAYLIEYLERALPR